MGRDPKTPLPGDECAFCWGEGKPFERPPPPKKLYIVGEGFDWWHREFNGVHLAEQVEDQPCLWKAYTYEGFMEWLASEGGFLVIFRGGMIYSVITFPCCTWSTHAGMIVRVT